MQFYFHAFKLGLKQERVEARLHCIACSVGLPPCSMGVPLVSGHRHRPRCRAVLSRGPQRQGMSLAAQCVAHRMLLLQGQVCRDGSSLPRSDAIRCDGRDCAPALTWRWWWKPCLCGSSSLPFQITQFLRATWSSQAVLALALWG